jgi:hypothetical protein
VIKNAIWVSEREIPTVDSFWATVGDELEVLIEEQIARRDDETTAAATSGGA